MTEPGRDAAEGLSPALDTGLLVSLAQASTVVSPNTSAAADFGIVSVWSVMTHPAPAAGGGRADDPVAGDGGAATGGLTPSADMDECEGRDNGDRESREGEQCGGWQAAHVELEVPYWGASHPYLEGVHHIDVKLLSPAERHSLARGGRGSGEGGDAATAGGWGQAGWVGEVGREVESDDKSVIWTPPPQRRRTALVYNMYNICHISPPGHGRPSVFHVYPTLSDPDVSSRYITTSAWATI